MENLGSLAKEFEPSPLDTRDPLRGLRQEESDQNCSVEKHCGYCMKNGSEGISLRDIKEVESMVC